MTGSSRKMVLGVAVLFMAVGPTAAENLATQPPPELAALTLPAGALQMEAGSDTTITFLDRDRTAKAGDMVTVWAFQIFDPGVPTAQGPAVQIVQRRVLDCRARTVTDTGSIAYDVAGKVVMWLPAATAEPIEPQSPAAAEAVVLCDGGTLPTEVTTGHAEALKAGQAMLRSRR